MGLLVDKDTIYDDGGYRKVKEEAKKPKNANKPKPKGNGKGGKSVVKSKGGNDPKK